MTPAPSLLRLFKHALLLLALLAMAPAGVWASDPAHTPVQWSGKDVQGAVRRIPDSGKASVLLFLMADQPQSRDALAQAAKIFTAGEQLQILAIYSGEQAVAHARVAVDKNLSPFPLLADPEYDLSGALNVRVWPTTVFLGSDGKPLASVPGLPVSYTKDLQAYRDFLGGKLDDAALKKELAAHELVASTMPETARRHLQLVERLQQRRDFAAAEKELALALQDQSKEPRLLLEMARTLALQNKAQQALEVLDKNDLSALPPWQVNAVRGHALLIQQKWDLALTTLRDGLSLNPDPAATYYLLGRVLQHQGDAAAAAEAFRTAFERSVNGQMYREQGAAAK